MKAITGFTFGIIVTLLALSYAMPAQKQYETQVITRTVTEYEPLDIGKYRDISQISEHDDQLNAECAYVIQHHTDEPLAGIVLYISRYWGGDACAAADHLLKHGWY